MSRDLSGYKHYNTEAKGVLKTSTIVSRNIKKETGNNYDSVKR